MANKGEEALLLALAAGATVPVAARQAGVSDRTVYRRLQDPAFRSRVDEARAELVGRAVGKLANLGGLATDTLEGVLNDPEGATREKLTAARATLEFMLRGVEIDTLSREVRELKRRLEDLTRERGGRPATDPPGAGDAPGSDSGPTPDSAAGGPGPATLPLGDAPRPVAGRVPPAQWHGGPDDAPLFPPGG